MESQSKLLDLAESERAFHIEMCSLSTDKDGNEVLLGLTCEESHFYIECLHLRARSSELVRGSELDRWIGLDEKHEFARFAMITAEAAERGIVKG